MLNDFKLILLWEEDIYMGSSSYENVSGRPLCKCNDAFEFWVVFQGESKEFFSNFRVGQEIKLKLVKGILPRLEVVTIRDDLLLGLVPPIYSMIINCMDNGWEYYGSIIKIEGNKYDPKIYVRIEGDK